MSSGLMLDLPVDGDWTVATATGDHGTVEATFGDAATGAEVTLRGDRDVLVGLLEAALGDLSPRGCECSCHRSGFGSVARGCGRCAYVHRLDDALGPPPVAERELVPERLVTPDEIKGVIDKAQKAGLDFPEVRFGDGEDAGWMPVYAVSGGQGTGRTLHCLAPNDDTILKSARRWDTLPARDAGWGCPCGLVADHEPPCADAGQAEGAKGAE